MTQGKQVEEAYIVSAARTSVVPHGGQFKNYNFDDLGAASISKCLKDAGIASERVDELIFSNALGAGGNPARVTALAAKLPQSVAGLSVDRQCVGGLDAVLLAKSMIASGSAQVVLAGGGESYSLRPQRFFKTSWDAEPIEQDRARFAPVAAFDPDMAPAAHALADQANISREQQDAWAVDSHQKAQAAVERLSSEISNPAGSTLSSDPFCRRLTMQTCQRAQIINGTITSANMAVAADGAAIVAVVSGRVLQSLNCPFALRIVDGATVGSDPRLPGIAPVKAIDTVLSRNAIKPSTLSVVELMEAFAAQAIACVNDAGLNPKNVNLGGGALARGHPIGASGAVLLVRLFHELQMRRGIGLAAIAGGGGLGTATLVETIDP